MLVLPFPRDELKDPSMCLFQSMCGNVLHGDSYLSGLLAEIAFADPVFTRTRTFALLSRRTGRFIDHRCGQAISPKSVVVGHRHQPSSILISPSVVGAIIGGLIHTFYISKIIPAQYRLLGGMVLGIVPGILLLVLSQGGTGMDYCKFICPGYVVGAICMV